MRCAAGADEALPPSAVDLVGAAELIVPRAATARSALVKLDAPALANESPPPARTPGSPMPS